MTGALSSHYADALVQAVFGENSGIGPEEAVDQIRSVEQLISGSSELQGVLLSPAINKQKKAAILSTFADELGLNRLIRNFLLVIAAHRRIKELPSIREGFEAAVDARLGWVPADIASARELNGQEREEVERALGTKLGKFIRAHYRVDTGLLAGVRVNAASKEYDATLRGKLESLRQRLSSGLS